MTNLGLVPIPEDHYRADLELLDRYQKYSAEIIRLSLLGIAGLAFFLIQIILSANAPPETKDSLAGIYIAVAAFLFILAAACALSHRYHSTDGLFYHFKSIRAANQSPPDGDTSISLANKRNRVYAKANYWLISGVGLFGAGGFFFVLGFARLIYLWAILA